MLSRGLSRYSVFIERGSLSIRTVIECFRLLGRPMYFRKLNGYIVHETINDTVGDPEGDHLPLFIGEAQQVKQNC